MDTLEAQTLIERIRNAIKEEYPTHPYEHLTRESFEPVVGNYTAMSLAFPYLQAGAMHRVFEHYLRSGFDVPNDVAVTATVGAFLCWDEFGGHAKVCAEGNRGLPSILDTSGAHANLFKEDVRRVLGHTVAPLWTKTTKAYLRELQYGLASVDPTTRVSHMVGFEKHADDMIGALWSSFTRLFGLDSSELRYFYTHVGGDDPAEAYHVDMTSRMVAKVIAREDVERLFDETLTAYGLSHQWCSEVAAHSTRGAFQADTMGAALCATS